MNNYQELLPTGYQWVKKQSIFGYEPFSQLQPWYLLSEEKIFWVHKNWKTDKKILEYLLLNADEIGSSDSIGEFIENGKLIAIDGEKKVEIVVKYKSAVITMAKYSKIFLAIIVIVSIIIKIIRGLRK